ncbi:phosphatase PAP2 family protein [Acuticoccus sp. 2012]|uniref:Phosphatase PAP2 family protein n=2 Tax=Acuticoccus mangrovi TaxID=2796142 RepID=A0A934MJS4_9HYPH|nr:phosphatase PAP2 family protein [Acuticoccus mangrovi]
MVHYGRWALGTLQRFTEFRALLIVLAVTGCGWLFIAIAEEVLEGDTHQLDSALLLGLRAPGDIGDPIGPPWVEELARDFTALGGFGILASITLAVCGFLYLQRQVRTMSFLAIAVLGGTVVTTLAKLAFDRPRPELVSHEVAVSSASFPSGHSMLAATTYLTLAVIVAHAQQRRRMKIYIVALAILVTFAVGASRVYLGVHWPTDVLAGWAGGAAWALSCWLVARWLEQRGAIEHQPVEGE